jgi:molybdopterin-guanine dinucleotide biosynthesis protein B
MTDLPCFGIAGWKNSGKTALVSGLVRELTGRGLKISTLKHAHHAFDLDTPGTDTHNHREAGASEVAIVSQNRWAIQHELADEQEPSFQEIVSRLSLCDLVLVEGYKREPIPKIEIIGPNGTDNPIWTTDKSVLAIACDQELGDCALPIFHRKAFNEIANFILNHHGIENE